MEKERGWSEICCEEDVITNVFPISSFHPLPRGKKTKRESVLCLVARVWDEKTFGKHRNISFRLHHPHLINLSCLTWLLWKFSLVSNGYYLFCEFVVHKMNFPHSPPRLLPIYASTAKAKRCLHSYVYLCGQKPSQMLLLICEALANRPPIKAYFDWLSWIIWTLIWLLGVLSLSVEKHGKVRSFVSYFSVQL